MALKNACDKADAIIAVSKSAKNDIIRYSPETEEKIYVLYSGVDKYYSYRIPDGFKENLYKKYNLKRDCLNILVNATHNYRKNIGQVLDVFINNPEIHKKCNLIITGNIINQNIMLKIKNSQINNIYMLGYLSKEYLRGIFQISDIFVYPSLYEGFGLPILEATTSGCLVLASNTSSIPEIIENKNLLFDPFDKNEIRDKLLWTIELGDEQRRFNWENTAEEMLKVYQLVLE
jgi:glycosyltransferase involved in cell wall biosynthesis